MNSISRISVVIPTYRRGEALLNTLKDLFAQTLAATSIIVVDQTDYQLNDPVYVKLKQLHEGSKIHWLRLSKPSIPHAMNQGLVTAQTEYVLFLDDDIEIDQNFLAEHEQAIKKYNAPSALVGQVIQPWQQAENLSKNSNANPFYQDLDFPFHSTQTAEIHNCMAGNLCVNREQAIAVGGFDEAFSGAAYRFETEFCRRLCRHTGERFRFVPEASLRHLRLPSGGTRAQTGGHLTSASPIHSSGDYYFAFRESHGLARWGYIAKRLFNSIKAKFYLKQPWWIPIRLVGELRGFFRAFNLQRIAPQYLSISTRIAVVITHPIQHWVPVYMALAAEADIKLKVYFIGENGVKSYLDEQFNQAVKWDIPLLDGYEYEFLEKGKIIQDFSFNEVDSRYLSDRIRQFAPHVIWVNGYSHKANWRVVWNKPTYAKLIYSSDSNLTDPRQSWKKIIKEAVVRYFFKQCEAFLSVGPNNQTYLEHYGVASKKIHQVPYPVDMQRILQSKEDLMPDSKKRLRSELGIPMSAVTLLFLGKLIAHKRPQDLIEALSYLQRDQQQAQMQTQRKDVYVLFVGSGDQLEELQSLAEQKQLTKFIKFAGFVNQSAIPAYIEASDILVLPSSKEPFGAVVSEVLPFGLPVIVSDAIGAIGCSAKLDENALAYPCGNAEELAKKIQRLATDQALYQRMSLASYNLTMEHDSRRYADVVLDIVRCLKEV